MNMLKMCLNWKVLAGLAAVAAGIYVLAPQAFAAAVPLLVLAACPISMIFMMKMMSGGTGQRDATEVARPGGNDAGDPADADELDAELQRLHARQTAVADQLEALRREERQRA